MADAVATQILSDGGKTAVLKFTNIATARAKAPC
jgi:hypothetical protein